MFGIREIAFPSGWDWRQIGGYACGHTKTEVALRDELPVSLCPRLAGFALID